MALTFFSVFAAALPGFGATQVAPTPTPLWPRATQAASQLVALERDQARARATQARRRRHRRPQAPPMRPALASYYTDHGTGACGVGDVQAGYRFASLFLRCGTRVHFCYGRACADAVMSDHGPYIAGRSFDLNSNLRAALGCPGLCYLRYRVTG